MLSVDNKQKTVTPEKDKNGVFFVECECKKFKFTFTNRATHDVEVICPKCGKTTVIKGEKK